MIYLNFLSCFCISKHWEHCLLPYTLLSTLQIFASPTLGKFPSFLRANLYMYEMCCCISARSLEVGNISHAIVAFLPEMIPIILNFYILN